ncbi:LysR family transcriptional regulator [Phenylobacterium sp.]|uniref:LysR family transcriptional regulator n=1 Tax=Phenylobacterium sp. TaxID=1871053 RepID=UPI0035B2284B
MDRLEAMAIFVAIVDTGSLSAAGRRLGMPLPTISRKLTHLETHLQTSLLVRSTRKLALTDAGTSFLASARRILDQVDEAERSAAGEYLAPKGELLVAAPILFGRLHVLPLVNAFLARHPEVRVRLELSDRNTDIIEDHIDVAVRIGPLPDSTLVATRVGAVRSVFCASPAYLAAHGTPRTEADLDRLDAIVFSALGERDTWPGSSRERGRTRLTVTTAESALDAAIEGIGVTRILSYQAAAAVREGRLQLILRHLDGPSLDVSLIHAGQGRVALKARAFLDMAAPHLTQELAHLSR